MFNKQLTRLRNAVYKSFEVTAGIEERVKLSTRQLLTGIALRLPSSIWLRTEHTTRPVDSNSFELIWLDVAYDPTTRSVQLLTMTKDGLSFYETVEDAIRRLQDEQLKSDKEAGVDYRGPNCVGSNEFDHSGSLYAIFDALEYETEKSPVRKSGRATLAELFFEDNYGGAAMRWPKPNEEFTRKAVKSFFSGLRNSLLRHGGVQWCVTCQAATNPRFVEGIAAHDKDEDECYLKEQRNIRARIRSGYSDVLTPSPSTNKKRKTATKDFWKRYRASYATDQLLCVLRALTLEGRVFDENGIGWIETDSDALMNLLYPSQQRGGDRAWKKAFLPGLRRSNYSERICEQCTAAAMEGGRQDDHDESRTPYVMNPAMVTEKKLTNFFSTSGDDSGSGIDSASCQSSFLLAEDVNCELMHRALRLADVHCAWRPTLILNDMVHIAHCDPCPWMSIGLFVPVAFKSQVCGVRMLFNPTAMHAVQEFISECCEDLADGDPQDGAYIAADVAEMKRLVGVNFFESASLGGVNQFCKQIAAPDLLMHVRNLLTNKSSFPRSAAADTTQQQQQQRYHFSMVYYDWAARVLSSFQAATNFAMDEVFAALHCLLVDEASGLRDYFWDNGVSVTVSDKSGEVIFCKAPK